MKIESSRFSNDIPSVSTLTEFCSWKGYFPLYILLNLLVYHMDSEEALTSLFKCVGFIGGI